MKKVPVTLVCITASHSSGVMSTAALRFEMPALLTRTSTLPKASITVAIACSIAECDPRLNPTGTTRVPMDVSFATTSERFSTRVAETATSKPSRASADAVAAPIPYEAPVTNAVRLPVGLWFCMHPPLSGVADFSSCRLVQRMGIPQQSFIKAQGREEVRLLFTDEHLV